MYTQCEAKSHQQVFQVSNLIINGVGRHVGKYTNNLTKMMMLVWAQTEKHNLFLSA
jgi:hypothetical protein